MCSWCEWEGNADYFSQKKAPKSNEQLFAEWTDKYGDEGAKVIRDTVAANVEDYEYLKQFALKV
jgi:uncharacterized protein (DUF427 family)